MSRRSEIVRGESEAGGRLGIVAGSPAATPARRLLHPSRWSLDFTNPIPMTAPPLHAPPMQSAALVRRPVSIEWLVDVPASDLERPSPMEPSPETDRG